MRSIGDIPTILFNKDHEIDVNSRACGFVERSRFMVLQSGMIDRDRSWTSFPMFPMVLGIGRGCGLLCTIRQHGFPMSVHMSRSFPHQSATYPQIGDNFGEKLRIKRDNAISRLASTYMALDIVDPRSGLFVEKLLITRWKTSA